MVCLRAPKQLGLEVIIAIIKLLVLFISNPDHKCLMTVWVIHYVNYAFYTKLTIYRSWYSYKLSTTIYQLSDGTTFSKVPI